RGVSVARPSSSMPRILSMTALLGSPCIWNRRPCSAPSPWRCQDRQAASALFSPGEAFSLWSPRAFRHQRPCGSPLDLFRVHGGPLRARPHDERGDSRRERGQHGVEQSAGAECREERTTDLAIERVAQLVRNAGGHAELGEAVDVREKLLLEHPVDRQRREPIFERAAEYRGGKRA